MCDASILSKFGTEQTDYLGAKISSCHGPGMTISTLHTHDLHNVTEMHCI